MPPIIAITGIPRFTIIDQIPEYKYAYDPAAWDVRFLNAQNSTGFEECWRSVKVLLEDVEQGNGDGLHVLAFHKSDQTRAKFEDQIKPFHRLRLLDRDYLKAYGTQAFSEYLDRVLEEEALWRRDVRPCARRHPLLLPEACFAVPSSLTKTWERARSANGARDCKSVATMIAGLSRLHKETDAYHDIKKYRFRYTGNHGKPSAPAFNWKMCFRFPDRMHYDVNPVDNEEQFTWFVDGIERRFVTHANVTPHGVLV